MNDQKDKDWQALAEEESADDNIEESPENGEMGEIGELVGELSALRGELDKSKDALVRAQADMENIRRRAERDVSNAHKYSVEKFAGELLLILDSLEQGLSIEAAEQANLESLHKGMELTHKLLIDAFGKFAIEQINPEGEMFDPGMHEAISMQETADAEPNTILAVVQKGYKLHGRMLRPARVIVAKGLNS